MTRDTILLMTVGIVSSVAAWGITKVLDRYVDQKKGHKETRAEFPHFGKAAKRQTRRNKMLAGVGTGGAFA